MRRIFIVMSILCALCALCANAQTVEQTAGIYYAYPGPLTEPTAAPEGFRPFYISHYGRHGSRWVTEDLRYTDVYQAFDTTSCLTPLGEDVYSRLRVVLDDALGRSGSLSPLGERQHHDIAARMYDTFSEIFADSAEIEAVSSTSLRCAMSMSYFTESLKEKNPSLKVHRTAYDKDMDYIAHTSPEGKAFSADTASWRKEYWHYVRSTVNPDRLIGSLFSCPDNFSDEEKMQLAAGLYWIASDMQDVDIDVDFYDIFTYEELQAMWRCINARMYVCNGNCPLSAGVMKHCADNLLNDFIKCADAAVAGDGPSANLRFGHDTHLLRLLALMAIDGCAEEATEFSDFHNVWKDYTMSPMAANLQMVYYRNDDGDVIVKLLLNENEMTLPIESNITPYYRWTDLRPYLISCF